MSSELRAISYKLKTKSLEPRAKSLLITGGAGFIGSEFVRQGVKKGYKITVVDKLTYAGDLERLKEVKNKIKFYKEDICSKRNIKKIFEQESPQIVINFAAQTHVDRSIHNPEPFLKTNILGTQVLLELSKKYKIGKFIHISSDEVYGEIKKGKFLESSPLFPNSPYAVSKVAADLLIRAYIRTYRLPAIIIRPCNCYGPWQYPEKLIPLTILKVLKNKKIPIYGKGRNIREWLYVKDCAEAIFLILAKGKEGEIYNLGSGEERKNIEVVEEILKILGRDKQTIKFVSDRPGHDFRYSLNSQKLFKHTGWKPEVKFDIGIKLTVNWYLIHKKWLLT